MGEARGRAGFIRGEKFLKVFKNAQEFPKTLINMSKLAQIGVIPC